MKKKKIIIISIVVLVLALILLLVLKSKKKSDVSSTSSSNDTNTAPSTASLGGGALEVGELSPSVAIEVRDTMTYKNLYPASEVKAKSIFDSKGFWDNEEQAKTTILSIKEPIELLAVRDALNNNHKVKSLEVFIEFMNDVSGRTAFNESRNHLAQLDAMNRIIE